MGPSSSLSAVLEPRDELRGSDPELPCHHLATPRPDCLFDTRTAAIVARPDPLGQLPRSPAPERPLARIVTAALTDPGRRRARNEDAVLLAADLDPAGSPGAALAVVADGLGGHRSGHLASALAAAELRDALIREGPLTAAAFLGSGSRSPAGERMAAAVRRCDARIRAEGASDPERAGMGTTLTALLVHEPARRAVVGHVGDSRAYLLESGRLRRLTRDHTWVQAQIDAGALDEGDARAHPWAHVVTQALGVGDGIECEVVERDLAPGQLYLLCSDGLTTMLDDGEIERVLGEASADGVAAAARALVDAANERGGADNVTVALLEVRPGPAA